MRLTVPALAIAAWMVATVARTSAQNAAPPAPKLASSGVYTAEQAGRGRDVFGAICQGCHNIGSQSGEAFAKRWRSVRLSELFLVFENTMPKDDPGSLSTQERADVVAYLLKINNLAAGSTELPVDIEQLKKIVIDLGG